jgi:HEAT repeat protein
MRSKNPAVRAQAISLFAETSCMPGASTLLASGLDDKEVAVRIATIKTLSRLGDWNDQNALIALCRFAGNRTGVLDERTLAIELLSQGLAMRCSPNISNQLIYELLVHLLDDEEKSLRVIAISYLSKIAGNDFGFQAQESAQERRDAVIAWRRWYIELFNPQPPKA